MDFLTEYDAELTYSMFKEEFLEEGRVEGREEGLKQSLEFLLDAGIITPEQAEMTKEHYNVK